MMLVQQIFLGIILAIIAAFCFNFAIILQKLGLNQLPSIDLGKGFRNLLISIKLLFYNKYWLTGFLLGIFGWFFNVIAISQVSILVVAPIISIGLIIFVFAAWKILKEKIGLKEVISIGMLILATIFLMQARISQISIDLFSIAFPFLIYTIIMIMVSIIFFMLSRIYKETKLEGIFLIFIGAILYSQGILFTNIFTQALFNTGINPIYFWEILFGFIWLDTHVWVVLSFYCMIFFNGSSILFYQTGLQKNKAIFMYPIFNSITLLLPVFGSLFIFQQRFQNNILFLISLILILISTFMLSKFQAIFENIERISKEMN
ncbi:MAG: hypothetical protein ACTSWE_00645 [Promethearchaeota archaeon]